MYVRARYGHGGRLGYDQEWRADPQVAGGGELLDQGVHLIVILRRRFAGDFTEARPRRQALADAGRGQCLPLLPSTATGSSRPGLHVSCHGVEEPLSSPEYLSRECGKLQVDGAPVEATAPKALDFLSCSPLWPAGDGGVEYPERWIVSAETR